MQRVALITGGASGICGALTKALAEKNWRVYVVGRNQSKLEKIQSEYPNHVVPIQADLASLDSPNLIASKIVENKIDVIVHGAAIIDPMADIRKLDPIEFEKIIRINVTSCLVLTQALLNRVEGGRVLFISSGAATFAIPEWTAYCVSKAALWMLKLNFQNEVKSVAFSDVKPGIVETDMLQHVIDSDGSHSGFYHDLQKKHGLIKPYVLGQFLSWMLTEVDVGRYQATEWDIYDTSHHHEWLKEGEVPPLDE